MFDVCQRLVVPLRVNPDGAGGDEGRRISGYNEHREEKQGNLFIDWDNEQLWFHFLMFLIFYVFLLGVSLFSLLIHELCFVLCYINSGCCSDLTESFSAVCFFFVKV